VAVAGAVAAAAVLVAGDGGAPPDPAPPRAAAPGPSGGVAAAADPADAPGPDLARRAFVVEPGDALRFRVERVASRDDGAQVSRVELVVAATVERAEGLALDARVEALRLDNETPLAALRYDSAAPDGAAQGAHALVGPLVGDRFEVGLEPRSGRVLGVRGLAGPRLLAGDGLDGFDSIAAAVLGVLSDEGVAGILETAWHVFPADGRPRGAAWTVQASPSPDERARLRARAGDLDGALADLDRAVRLEPRGSPGLYLHRARLRARVGGLDRALADLDRAVAAGTRQGYVEAERGDLLWSAGRDAEAAAAYRRALQAGGRDRLARGRREAVARALAELEAEAAAPDAASPVDFER